MKTQLNVAIDEANVDVSTGVNANNDATELLVLLELSGTSASQITTIYGKRLGTTNWEALEVITGDTTQFAYWIPAMSEIRVATASFSTGHTGNVTVYSK